MLSEIIGFYLYLFIHTHTHTGIWDQQPCRVVNICLHFWEMVLCSSKPRFFWSYKGKFALQDTQKSLSRDHGCRSPHSSSYLDLLAHRISKTACWEDAYHKEWNRRFWPFNVAHSVMSTVQKDNSSCKSDLHSIQICWSWRYNQMDVFPRHRHLEGISL